MFDDDFIVFAAKLGTEFLRALLLHVLQVHPDRTPITRTTPRMMIITDGLGVVKLLVRVSSRSVTLGSGETSDLHFLQMRLQRASWFPHQGRTAPIQIGRASCRERV